MKRVLAPWLLAGMATLSAHADIPLHERQSGTLLLSPSNRAIQEDLSQNPASFWLMEGETLWQQPAGPKQ